MGSSGAGVVGVLEAAVGVEGGVYVFVEVAVFEAVSVLFDQRQ